MSRLVVARHKASSQIFLRSFRVGIEARGSHAIEPEKDLRLIEKIISGGQSGVDRAALDWAIQRGIPHGGWCPKGRRAEDGIIPEPYQLEETPRRSYQQRTKWNVRDSDATLVVTLTKELSGGSQLTQQSAQN